MRIESWLARSVGRDDFARGNADPRLGLDHCERALRQNAVLVKGGGDLDERVIVLAKALIAMLDLPSSI